MRVDEVDGDATLVLRTAASAICLAYAMAPG